MTLANRIELRADPERTLADLQDASRIGKHSIPLILISRINTATTDWTDKPVQDRILRLLRLKIITETCLPCFVRLSTALETQ